MGIDHFLRQLRDGELESESSEEEPEIEEEPQGNGKLVKNDQMVVTTDHILFYLQ